MRALETAARAASEQNIVCPLLLFAADFESGMLRLTTATDPITTDADGDGVDEQYLAAGSLLSCSPLEETSELQATGLRVSLSGLPGDLLARALGEHYQGRRAQLWLLFLDQAEPEDGAIIPAPITLFIGRMDVMGYELGTTATVSLSIESVLVDWERSRLRRYTDTDQRDRFPGDAVCSLVDQAASKELLFGSLGAPQQAAGGGGKK